LFGAIDVNHEAAMLAFVKLAGLSQSRQQLGPRDKFLVLAAVAATESGCDTVAERCRQLVLEHNPGHILKKHESVALALANEAFQTYLKQARRFCSHERAEHLLTQLEIAPGIPTANSGLTASEYSLLLLGPRS
jgi:hypothetical protein